MYNETWELSNYPNVGLLTKATNTNGAETWTDSNPGLDGNLRYDFRTYNHIDTG